MVQLIKGCKYHTISTDGVVTNTKTNHVKKAWLGKNGYYCIDIQEEGNRLKQYIHRLLAIHFIPNPEDKRTVNHKDGIKTNNCLLNLEWATDSENVTHAYLNNLNYASNKKLDVEHLKPILQRFLLGENLTVILKDYDFSATTLSTYLPKYAKLVNKDEEFKNEKRRQQLLRKTGPVRKIINLQMLDKVTNKIIKIFTGYIDAAEYLGKTSTGPISNVIAGRTQTGYGYKWQLA